MATYAERLVEVQTAISAIVTGGQRVMYQGREVDYADLADLVKLEQWLTAMTERAGRGGGIRVRGGTPV